MKAVSPVLEGLEEYEILVAENQPEYETLPMLKAHDGYYLCRFELSEKDMENVRKTKSIYLYMLVGNNPVTPIALQTEHPITAIQGIIDVRQ